MQLLDFRVGGLGFRVARFLGWGWRWALQVIPGHLSFLGAFCCKDKMPSYNLTTSHQGGGEESIPGGLPEYLQNMSMKEWSVFYLIKLGLGLALLEEGVTLAAMRLVG